MLVLDSGAGDEGERHRHDAGEAQRVLDDAARRIVHMASPFAPFPPDIQRDTDVLVITRNWTFTRGDQLETH